MGIHDQVPDDVNKSQQRQSSTGEELRQDSGTEEMNVARERMRKAAELSLNQVKDSALRTYVSDVVADRMSDIVDVVPEKDREDFLVYLGSSNILSGFNVGAYQGQVTMGDSRLIPDLIRQWGADVARSVFLEMLRKDVLQSLTVTQMQSGMTRFDMLDAYAYALSLTDEEFEKVAGANGHVSVRDYARSLTNGRKNWDTLYEKDSELFVDIMMVGARQISGGSRGSMQEGLQGLPHSSWNGNFGAEILTDLQGRPYRIGHREDDVAVVDDRLQLWERQTGERPKTIEDLRSEVTQLKLRERVLESELRKQQQEGSVELARERGEFDRDLTKLTRENTDLRAENVGLQDALDAVEKREEALKQLLAKVQKEAESGTRFMKSGTSIEKILDLLGS